MSLDKFEIYGESAFFYFYILKFFWYIFLIISALSMISVVLNFKGKGFSNWSDIHFVLKSSIANRGFDRENSSQFFNFEAKLRKDAVKQVFFDNYKIFKAA